MAPYYEDDQITLHHGKSEHVLPTLPADSVDAVVTDPPYELGFMGKTWDATGIAYSVGLWREVLRVLKPGGHLLAFGGTRTVHRMTCAIEDAGFEIRDGIDWLYGSGFPKSLDVSKAIDKQRDDRSHINRVTGWLAQQRDRAGLTNRDIDAAFGFSGMAGHWTAAPHLKIAQVPRWEQWQRLRDLIGFGDELDAEVWRLNGRKGTPGEAWSQREIVGERITGRGAGRGAVAYIGDSENRDVTAPATAEARRWSGWGTALKPAREPIVMARKPLAGTVAANVLMYGTGALNIDACRTGSDQRTNHAGGASSLQRVSRVEQGYRSTVTASVGEESTVTGRWPTNVVLSHAGNDVDGDLCADGCVPGCAVAELDRQSGVTSSGSRKAGTYGLMGYMGADAAPMPAIAGDSGGASRFFPVFRYEAKAPTSERPKVDGEAHATVKPLSLMRWLVQLVTPPGGMVLEPFAGSGTTVEACLVEGYRCIAVEREAKYLPLIMSRISKPIEPTLFGVLDECEGAP